MFMLNTERDRKELKDEETRHLILQRYLSTKCLLYMKYIRGNNYTHGYLIFMRTSFRQPVVRAILPPCVFRSRNTSKSQGH